MSDVRSIVIARRHDVAITSTPPLPRTHGTTSYAVRHHQIPRRPSEPRNLVRGRARTLTGTTVASSKPNTTTPTRATALEYSPASPAQTSDYPSTHHGYHPTPHTHHHEATIHRHHPSDPDSKHAAHPPNPHSRKVRHFAKQPPRQATQQFVSKSNDLPNEDAQAEPLRTASAHAYENRLGT